MSVYAKAATAALAGRQIYDIPSDLYKWASVDLIDGLSLSYVTRTNADSDSTE
jgi:hypothetical protein